MPYSLEQIQEVAELATKLEGEVGMILRSGFPLESQQRVKKLLERMIPYKNILQHYIKGAITRGATGLEKIMPQELQ